MDDLLSTQVVADLLGVTRQTIINYIQENRLAAQRLGKAYKISEQEFMQFVKDSGLPPSDMAQLRGRLESRSDKRTRSLGQRNLEELELNQPPRPIIPQLETLYFLSVKPMGPGSEIIVKVKENRFFVGRHSLASLSIQDPYISTIHANLIFDGAFVTVQDQSTNGTYVGAQQLLHQGASQVLGDGDQCRVGKHILTIVSPHRIDIYLNR